MYLDFLIIFYLFGFVAHTHHTFEFRYLIDNVRQRARWFCYYYYYETHMVKEALKNEHMKYPKFQPIRAMLWHKN